MTNSLKKESGEGWGDSSVVRVLALQAQGPGFNPQHRQLKKKESGGLLTNKGETC